MNWRLAVLATATAVPLAALLAGPAATQGTMKTSRLSAAIAYQAVATAVEVGEREAAAGREAVVVTILPDSADKYLSERFWTEGEPA